MADRFLIGPYGGNSGLVNAMKPWAIPDDAFAQLTNAYVFRGRVRKRFGSRWMSGTQQGTRLRLALTDETPELVGTTDASGDLAGFVSGGYYAVGQGFVIGAASYGVISSASGAQPMAQTVTTPTATYNIGTGAFAFLGAPALTQVFFYNYAPIVTNGSGNASGVVPGNKFAAGQMFSIGTALYTVVDPSPGVHPMLKTDGTTTATFDVSNGAFNFVGAPASLPVYFYPAEPVMGLLSYQTDTINNEPVIAFDTQFAYQFLSGAWERLALSVFPGDAVWTGDNKEFFWGATWFGTDGARKVFFVTNFNESEPNYMRAFNASLTNGWQQFRPLVNNSDYMFSARIIVPFKNRLVFLNTWEGTTIPGTNHQNRARYSQVGSPFDTNAFNATIPGRGNAIDAATTEAIVSAEFVKDRLIVFFENSTWELVYTGNQAYPFTWQQINTELGCESTFSVVPFDKVCIGVGNVGVHACNGANVDRIDEKIPNEVFAIHNTSDGPVRVYGIRDYEVEMIYWTFPDDTRTTDSPFPNQVLVFDYVKGNWALNNDSITVFGYFYPPSGITWDSTTITWSSEDGWTSGELGPQNRRVIAGNQQGFVFIVDPQEPANASVLQITNISVSASNVVTIICVNHNLQLGDYIYISGIQDTGNIGSQLNGTIQKVEIIGTVSLFAFVFDGIALAGTYQGNGVMARVSEINILTKEYNFYVQQGRNAYVSKVDFQVDRTVAGQIQADFLVSTSLESMNAESGVEGTQSLLGTGTLDTFPYPTIPFESTALRLWHPVFFQADGEFIQFNFYLNDEQMRDTAVRISGFVLHSFIIVATPSSSRLQ